MNEGFSIITPAYGATATICATVKSVLAQSFPDWEMLIISDDGCDYASLLAGAGVKDERIRFLSTSNTGTGSSNARNVGLDAAENDFIAILDADDQMVPEKLEILAARLGIATLVSTGLAIHSATGEVLRHVGCGSDISLTPQAYKFTNFSMDSMIAYRREDADPRYDQNLPCLTDLDFVLKLFATQKSCFHIARPLHIYAKQVLSITNGPGSSQRIAQTKRRLLDRLQNGHYSFASEDGGQGFQSFLRLSLEAEKTYEAALEKRAGLLFEDHLELYLVKHPLF